MRRMRSQKAHRTTTFFEPSGCRTQQPWNLAGVEPGNHEGPGCWDLGRVLVLIKMTRFVGRNGTNYIKRGSRGQNPAKTPRSFWCGRYICMSSAPFSSA